MRAIIILFLVSLPAIPAPVPDFDKYFTDKVLRFDFLLAGNSVETALYPAGMKEEPFYAGSKTLLTDPFNYGDYKYELRDLASDSLIYSRSFCTLYNEWQTTAEARNMKRVFHEVATMPFPRNKATLAISERDRKGSFIKLYETIIDPEDHFIRKEKPVNTSYTRIQFSGDPSVNVDLAFIAEGYTADGMEKFREDVRRMTEALFAEAPFSSYRDKFNIYAVETVSDESGTDVPLENHFVNTALNTSFSTFNIDRYLTTLDFKAVNDQAAIVPHDHIIILINTDKYGGGGVYNYYSGTVTDHPLSLKVFIHELGHGFAGLADEYFSSPVAYEEFYPHDVEPWEPNITTRVNFKSKWEKLIDKNIPVPTPAIKEYGNVTGLFEGAGYSEKGIFRAEQDCRMKSYSPKGFCTVCRDAIERMIKFYTR
jgi:hypothetical protein